MRSSLRNERPVVDPSAEIVTSIFGQIARSRRPRAASLRARARSAAPSASSAMTRKPLRVEGVLSSGGEGFGSGNHQFMFMIQRDVMGA